MRGAVGICVAKLSEAEALVPVLDADGGPPVPVLVTSPLGGPGAARRAAALARRCHLSLVVDHVDGVTELAAAVPADAPVTVLCDVDVGPRPHRGHRARGRPRDRRAGRCDARPSGSAASRATPVTPSTWPVGTSGVGRWGPPPTGSAR